MTFKTETKQGKGGAYQVINPPNLLRAKVGPGQGIDPALVEQAEAAVAELADTYTEWVQEDLAKLEEAVASAETDALARREHLDRAYAVSHDMKGQAGTFGYALMTRVAASLCRFVDALKEKEVVGGDFDVIRAHIDAMKAIILNDVKGEGGQIGRQIAEGLERIVGRCAAE